MFCSLAFWNNVALQGKESLVSCIIMTPDTLCTLACIPRFTSIWLRSTKSNAFQGPFQPRSKNLKSYNTLCISVHVQKLSWLVVLPVKKTVCPKLRWVMWTQWQLSSPGNWWLTAKNVYIGQKQKSINTNKILPLIAFFSLMFMFMCLYEFICAKCM